MKPKSPLGVVCALLLAAVPFSARGQSMEGQGQAIVTVLPAHPTENALRVSQQDIRELKVDGKPSQVTGWTPLRDKPVELVLLLDSAANTNLGTQMDEISMFAKELPPNTQMSIAWMQNGSAVLASPLSADPNQILKGLHLPLGPAGANASPYFSLSDLAKNWPSQNRSARRVVLIVSDGIDDYSPHFDPNDPYVQAAITDSVRSGLIVYSIHWQDQGRLSRFGWAQDAGQNLLQQITEATGGVNFWQGLGNPVSIDPYLRELRQRLNNQFQLSFVGTVGSKPSVEHFELKLAVPEVKVDAPQQVLVQPTTQAQR